MRLALRLSVLDVSQRIAHMEQKRLHCCQIASAMALRGDLPGSDHHRALHAEIDGDLGDAYVCFTLYRAANDAGPAAA